MPGIDVTGIAHDSTSVRPGDVYAALPGARAHGARFAADAVARGAVAILTDRAGADLIEAGADLVEAGAGQTWAGAGESRGARTGVPMLITENPRAVLGDVAATIYGRPADTMPVVGLTGTAGKTTTAYLVESGLRAAGHTTCLIGTVETRIAGTVIDSERTTPEATDLHALFAAARERGVTAAVMEVSSHALSYGRVDGVRFAVGGFTNLGLDHLDFHADADDYFAAKARLFDGRCAAEVLNLDDPAVRRLARAGRITYSAAGDPAATWRAEKITRDGFEQHFTVVGPHHAPAHDRTHAPAHERTHAQGRAPAEARIKAGVGLPGRHNVANALLAIACLVELGVDPETAAAGVAACRGVPGRLERVDAPGPVLGVVDYAHKPDAIVAVLAALREVGPGRLICVIGAGGDRDRGKRGPMGAAAAQGADVVVVTDDNPRMEDPAAIRADVRAGAVEGGATEGGATEGEAAGRGAAGRGGARVLEVDSRRDAIAEAVRLAGPGDVVALLGKGHEKGQDAGGVTHAFDDRVELAAALAERFAGVRT